eukprot:TRINITY_DN15863_c0_g1_i3.p1 TRINITY_DN15863_c0_g1~~TRINITY_DN15863_c0_g1_i3.p1  ORF type:complete len:309 (-),score=43.15 TRINITY_DN15863_c0_g1_i3:171-1097(-)
MESFDFLLIGDAAVGKRSFLDRWADETFDQRGPYGLGVDFRRRFLEVDRQMVKVTLWTNSGQERWRAMTRTMFRKMQGIILSYDVCRRSTFEGLGDWLAEVDKSVAKDASLILVGCQSDRTLREITYEEGQACAAAVGVPFLETSAKYGTHVEEAVEVLLREAALKSQPVVLTVLAVTPRPGPAEPERKEGPLEVMLATMGGETFAVEVEAERAVTVADLAACVRAVRQVQQGVQLLSADGEVLLPQEHLPGAPRISATDKATDTANGRCMCGFLVAAVRRCVRLPAFIMTRYRHVQPAAGSRLLTSS